MCLSCLECSTDIPSGRFCSMPCRQTFNNRRAMRGAILYDLWRLCRRERKASDAAKLRSLMCEIELAWNDEDAGRKTYKPLPMALADIAALDLKPTTNRYVSDK